MCAIKQVLPTEDLMLISRNGVVNRQRVGEIRVIGRATQGVRLMALDEGDAVMDVARLIPDDESDQGVAVDVAQSLVPAAGLVAPGPEDEAAVEESVEDEL